MKNKLRLCTHGKLVSYIHSYTRLQPTYKHTHITFFTIRQFDKKTLEYTLLHLCVLWHLIISFSSTRFFLSITPIQWEPRASQLSRFHPAPPPLAKRQLFLSTFVALMALSLVFEWVWDPLFLNLNNLLLRIAMFQLFSRGWFTKDAS